MKLNCLDCKLKSEPFKLLTDQQLQKVDEHRAELSFRKGELLLKQGSLSSHIVYVREGFAKIYCDRSDETVVLGFATPGSFVGIQLLFDQHNLPFSVEALTDMQVCLKDTNVFKELILENPRFASATIETLSNELTQAYQRMFSLTTKQVNARFSEVLLFMRNIMYQSNPFRLTISKKELAGLISTSPENLSRLISEFKEKGLIKSQGQSIEIINERQLESLCMCDVHTMRAV